MRPVTILHNSVSLDGSVVGFDVDMATHYRLAASFEAQAHMVGSGTAISGIEQYGGGLRPETEKDLQRPVNNGHPPWVIVDSRARLLEKLHAFRGSEFGGDPIVMVSEETPRHYLEYIEERDYRYHVTGEKRVDLKAALKLLAHDYAVETLLVDAGPSLNGALLSQGLIDEISLLIVPALVGSEPLRLFSLLKGDVQLELLRQERIEPGSIWLHYRLIST
jgi:2,5-diamino-6-(ribosylamino)-4(3H)-pyrimidinone 5'-phosphate reductase